MPSYPPGRSLNSQREIFIFSVNFPRWICSEDKEKNLRFFSLQPPQIKSCSYTTFDPLKWFGVFDYFSTLSYTNKEPILFLGRSYQGFYVHIVNISDDPLNFDVSVHFHLYLALSTHNKVKRNRRRGVVTASLLFCPTFLRTT